MSEQIRVSHPIYIPPPVEIKGFISMANPASFGLEVAE